MESLDLVLVLKAIPMACERWWQNYNSVPVLPPVVGFCTYASMFIQDHFGGTIARTTMSNGVIHYWNILDGMWLDATRAQFSDDVLYGQVKLDQPRPLYLTTGSDAGYEYWSRLLIQAYQDLMVK